MQAVSASLPICHPHDFDLRKLHGVFGRNFYRTLPTHGDGLGFPDESYDVIEAGVWRGADGIGSNSQFEGSRCTLHTPGLKFKVRIMNCDPFIWRQMSTRCNTVPACSGFASQELLVTFAPSKPANARWTSYSTEINRRKHNVASMAPSCLGIQHLDPMCGEHRIAVLNALWFLQQLREIWVIS